MPFLKIGLGVAAGSKENNGGDTCLPFIVLFSWVSPSINRDTTATPATLSTI